MKLFLLSQNENCGYDTHDSAVVAAPDESQARLIHPGYGGWEQKLYSSWCKTPEAVTVRYLGEAEEGTEAGIILASFNA